MVSFLEYLVFFLAVFFPQNNSNVLVESFLAIWIFEPNWPFCKVYSLSKMADFQSGLLSRIYRVFSSSFFHRTTLTCLQNLFSYVFGHLSFWPKVTILQSLQPFQDCRFSKWSHFSNIWCFMQRFFPQNNSNVLAESFFLRFWLFEFLTQTDQFAKSIAFPRWPIFKMVSFLEYLVFFQAVFCTDQL